MNARSITTPVQVFTVHKDIVNGNKANFKRAEAISALLKKHYRQYRVHVYLEHVVIKLQDRYSKEVVVDMVMYPNHPARLAIVEQVVRAHYDYRITILPIKGQPGPAEFYNWLPFRAGLEAQKEVSIYVGSGAWDCHRSDVGDYLYDNEPLEEEYAYSYYPYEDDKFLRIDKRIGLECDLGI